MHSLLGWLPASCALGIMTIILPAAVINMQGLEVSNRVPTCNSLNGIYTGLFAGIFSSTSTDLPSVGALESGLG